MRKHQHFQLNVFIRVLWRTKQNISDVLTPNGLTLGFLLCMQTPAQTSPFWHCPPGHCQHMHWVMQDFGVLLIHSSSLHSVLLRTMSFVTRCLVFKEFLSLTHVSFCQSILIQELSMGRCYQVGTSSFLLRCLWLRTTLYWNLNSTPCVVLWLSR